MISVLSSQVSGKCDCDLRKIKSRIKIKLICVKILLSENHKSFFELYIPNPMSAKLNADGVEFHCFVVSLRIDMKVVGFSFVKNAVRFDYPIVEAIKSILPICDRFVVAVGDCDDGTRELIESIGSPKIEILNTVWDESLREGGRVLAEETNKAFDRIEEDADWAFYIQGDEVVHEQYLPAIQQAMERYKDNKEVEGLLFNYTHFYGSYDYVGDSRRWYRKEIRIVRPWKNIRSYRDAQGFRIDGRKLKVKPIDAWMYHYGWVKSPFHQAEKQKNFNKLWHSDEWVDKNVSKSDEFDYSTIDSLKLFEGTHPEVMRRRIENINWQFSFDPTKKNFGTKAKVLAWIEKHTGWRVGEYRNYEILK